jgi:short-subunit dehydrogenase
MPKSIAVFGAGPGLGRAVARRYAREGYSVVLVARRQEPLDMLAAELTSTGAVAYAITADLSDVDAVSGLAEQIRAKVDTLDAIYYGPALGGFIPVADLTPTQLRELMPPTVYTLVALVREFLPNMLDQRDGAILAATGASAVQGMPHIAGGVALAAQRNYLQALQAQVTEQGVYVGRLYIGAAIEHSAFHTQREAAKAAGSPVPEMPTVDPAHLADLLWTMQTTKREHEALHPQGLLDR